MLLVSITSFAQSGEALYRKYSDEPGVSGVYISPAMFRMIGRLPAMNINDDDVDITPIIRSLSGFYLINSENPEVNEALRAEMQHRAVQLHAQLCFGHALADVPDRAAGGLVVHPGGLAQKFDLLGILAHARVVHRLAAENGRDVAP